MVAALGDLNADGSIDILVANNEGASIFVNDGAGQMISDQADAGIGITAMDAVDFNRDGKLDIAVATDMGIQIRLAEDYLVYSDFETIPVSAADMLWADFDQDGDKDLACIDYEGRLSFYRNNRLAGFKIVDESVQVTGPGKLRLQDASNDGQLDVMVEVHPTVYDVVEPSNYFGNHSSIPTGKRDVRFALFDHLGTTKMLINDQCDVVWPSAQASVINEVLPFGKEKVVNPKSTEPTYNLNFTNKELDRDLELNYFGARYYQPDFPRFLSPDPVGGTSEVPISWNRYLYCRNDPVNYIDPDGCRVVEGQTILGDVIIQWVIGIENLGGTQNDPFQTLQNIVGMSTSDLDYYMQADGIGSLNAIDYKHFMKTVYWSSVTGMAFTGIYFGHLNEWILQRPWDPSFYNPEDVPSNIIGSMFGASLQSYIPLSVQLIWYLESISVNMSDVQSLESFKKFIAAYYEENPEWETTSTEYEYSSSPFQATNAANEPMWTKGSGFDNQSE